MPDYDYKGLSPFASFASGLAHGTFDSIAKDEAEAKEREDNTRKQTLGFLTSMIDKVTPESRPFLMKQIGDTLNIKGKHRSVWDRLLGRGQDWGNDAIANSLSQVMGNAVGPEQARMMRANTMIPQLIEGGQDPATQGQSLTQAAGLGNRLEFEDPYKRKIDQLETQYGLMNSNREYLQGERFRMQDENKEAEQKRASTYALKLEDQRAKDRAESSVRQLAEAYNRSGKYGGYYPAGPTVEHYQMAADAIEKREGLKTGILAARIPDIQEHTKLEKAQIDALAAGGKPLELKKFDKNVYDKASSHLLEWSRNKQALPDMEKKLAEQKQALLNFAQSKDVQFNETTGDFYSDKPERAGAAVRYADPKTFGGAGRQVKEYKEALAAYKKALGIVRAESDVLSSPEYEGYVKTDGNGDARWHTLIPKGSGSSAPGATGAGGAGGVDLTVPPLIGGLTAPTGGTPNSKATQRNADQTGAAIAAAGGVPQQAAKGIQPNQTFYANTSTVFPVGKPIVDVDGSKTGQPGTYVVLGIEKPTVPGKSRYKLQRIQ